MDIALYRIDWKNVQQAVTDPGCGYLFVANVTARSKGVEVEINWKATQNLLFRLSGAYTNAQYDLMTGRFKQRVPCKPGMRCRIFRGRS